MYVGFILLLVVQSFSSHLCQKNDSFKLLTRVFTSTNSSTALDEFKNHLLSLNYTDNCNISIIIKFVQDTGSVTVQCYNETQSPNSIVSFYDMTMEFKNTKFLYDSRAFFVYMSNGSWNREFITNWITLQSIAINKTKQTETVLANNHALDTTKYEIWGAVFNNKIDLCVSVSVDSIKNHSAYIYGIIYNNASKTLENATIRTINNNTDICLRYGSGNTTVINNFLLLIITPSDLVEPQRPFVVKETVSKEITNNKKSGMINISKLLIIIMSTVLVLILLVVFAVFLVHRYKYRITYHPTATS
jgi:hypothetical protein